MSQLVTVTRVSELSGRECKMVDAEGQWLVLFNVNGTSASATIAVQENIRAKTLPATPVTDFLQRLGSS